MTSRVIATSFALIAFAGALFMGLLAGNSLYIILFRAVLITVACYVVGRIVGFVANGTVQREIESHKERHPLPDNGRDANDLSAPANAT